MRVRCSSCLIATATVLELPPIGSSHAPTSCLCTRRNRSGQVALPLVVQHRSERGRVETPASTRTEPPGRSASSPALTRVRRQCIGHREARCASAFRPGQASCGRQQIRLIQAAAAAFARFGRSPCLSVSAFAPPPRRRLLCTASLDRRSALDQREHGVVRAVDRRSGRGMRWPGSRACWRYALPRGAGTAWACGA
jgi:hypothetical protein